MQELKKSFDYITINLFLLFRNDNTHDLGWILEMYITLT